MIKSNAFNYSQKTALFDDILFDQKIDNFFLFDDYDSCKKLLGNAKFAYNENLSCPHVA